MLVGILLLHQLRPLSGCECISPAPQPLTTGGWCVLVSQGWRREIPLLHLFWCLFIRALFIVVLVECLNRFHDPIHQVLLLPKIELQLRGCACQLILPLISFLLLGVHQVVKKNITGELLRLQLTSAVGESCSSRLVLLNSCEWVQFSMKCLNHRLFGGLQGGGNLLCTLLCRLRS